MSTKNEEHLKKYFQIIQKSFFQLDFQLIDQFIQLMKEARDRGATIYLCGNGGSSANASHMAVDFNKGLSHLEAKPFRVISLSDNIPTLMAIANDIHYESIFSEQLKNFLTPKDILIVFSGSGNSKNILQAVKYANSQGVSTIGFTGYDGGEVKNLVSLSLHVPCHDMQVSEDIHMILIHGLMRSIALNP